MSLTEEVQDLYIKNYKPLLREIKGDSKYICKSFIF